MERIEDDELTAQTPGIMTSHRTREDAGRAALMVTLIWTAKLNDVDPYAYLADTLTRIVDGHLANQIDDLLPWAYPKPAQIKDAA